MARNNIVMVRLDDDEHKKLKRLASKLNMKLGTFLRFLVQKAQ